MSEVDPLTQARQHIEKHLLLRASSDAAFRELLKSNPHAAIKELIGNDPIPSLKITVIEENAGEVVLVLPRSITQDELPDELLDIASGGGSYTTFPYLEGSMGLRSWGLRSCLPKSKPAFFPSAAGSTCLWTLGVLPSCLNLIRLPRHDSTSRSTCF